MSIFPVPATSYIVGRFDVNVDGNHNHGTIEVDVYPTFVSDTGHVDTDTTETLAHVEIPDTTDWASDMWYDTGLSSTREELAALPHDISQAVDAALAMARLKLAQS